MAEVIFNKLEKVYSNGFKAVHAIDLKIAEGEFMVIVGPSGCAKSTTLRMLAGLETISGGEVRIGDKIVNNLAPKERGIAMVFQNYALYPHMTVRENLAFGLKLSKLPKAQIETQVNEAAKILELEELLDRLPRQLSGGQAQRVAVGRAIVKKPDVFLFDEPLSNLDAKLRASMRIRISDLHKQLKASGKPATTVYVTHDQTEAMTTIDINTGAFVGHRNLDETIFNTNIEATQAIARQLRLRNLGGIIIIDFIDMNNEEHRRRVLHSLESALSKDRVKTSINGFSALGLVEMTRKRTRESIEHVLCQDCPVCKGRGTLKTVETVCYEIMREIVRVHHAYDSDRFLVYVSPTVGEALKSEESHALAEVELFVGKQVKVQIEPLYTQEQFDVVMM